MSSSLGRSVTTQQRWLIVAGLVALVLNLLVSINTGDWLYVSGMATTLAVLAPVLVVFQRNHNRRRADAEATGSFGATCNVYLDTWRRFLALPPWSVGSGCRGGRGFRQRCRGCNGASWAGRCW